MRKRSGRVLPPGDPATTPTSTPKRNSRRERDSRERDLDALLLEIFGPHSLPDEFAERIEEPRP